MAKNNLIRFRKEDYPEAEDWWSRAIFGLNYIVDYVYALNVTLGNLQTLLATKPTIQNFDIVFTSASDSTTNPEHNTYQFQSDLAADPKQLLIHVTNSSNPAFTTGVVASWHFSKGLVSINAITGLANSTKYTITITLF